MSKIHISEEQLAALRCPGCAAPLGPRPVMDPYVFGLRCGKGHHYVQTLRRAKIADVKRAPRFNPRYPKPLDTPAMIEHWLTDEACRAHLLDNVATMLRRIHEITVGGDKARSMPPYGFCPLCALPLDGDFQTTDGWSVGLQCKKGHRFAAMSGLSSCDDDPFVQMQAEPDGEAVRRYADVYSSPGQASYMHPDPSRILREYLTRAGR